MVPKRVILRLRENDFPDMLHSDIVACVINLSMIIFCPSFDISPMTSTPGASTEGALWKESVMTYRKAVFC